MLLKVVISQQTLAGWLTRLNRYTCTPRQHNSSINVNKRSSIVWLEARPYSTSPLDALNWTHWATLRWHPCLSRAATSASSQVNPIFCRSLPLSVRSWSTWPSLVSWYLAVQCLLWYALLVHTLVQCINMYVERREDRPRRGEGALTSPLRTLMKTGIHRHQATQRWLSAAAALTSVRLNYFPIQ